MGQDDRASKTRAVTAMTEGSGRIQGLVWSLLQGLEACGGEHYVMAW